jgi:hypothetical protein
MQRLPVCKRGNGPVDVYFYVVGVLAQHNQFDCTRQAASRPAPLRSAARVLTGVFEWTELQHSLNRQGCRYRGPMLGQHSISWGRGGPWLRLLHVPIHALDLFVGLCRRLGM